MFSQKQNAKTDNNGNNIKYLILPIPHCALTIIGGHFLDVEKHRNTFNSSFLDFV